MTTKLNLEQKIEKVRKDLSTKLGLEGEDFALVAHKSLGIFCVKAPDLAKHKAYTEDVTNQMLKLQTNKLKNVNFSVQKTAYVIDCLYSDNEHLEDLNSFKEAIKVKPVLVDRLFGEIEDLAEAGFVDIKKN